jgi:predicted nucleic acid-binding protein
MIVADTSLIASLFLLSPATPEAEAVFEKDPEWVAPSLWRSEFRNVLATQVKVLGLPVDDAVALFERAEDVVGEPELGTETHEILRWAQTGKLSAYDSEYVALADVLRVRLVTFDKGIIKAAPKIAVKPKAFLEAD